MLLPTKVWSQQITDSLENTGFIRSYSDLLSLSLDLNNKIEAFKLRTSGLNFDLYPNTDLALSAKFSFEFLIFSVSTSPDFLNMNSDSELRGDSDFFLLETNLALGDHLIQYLGFKKISGFYLKNSSDFDPSWTYGDPYFQFPKLVYTSLEGNTTYKLNKDYFIQINTGNEPQKSGVFLNDSESFIDKCINEYNLQVRGLMCIPPQNVNPEEHFIKLRDLGKNFNLPYLSMGMSDDFETAIKCGSTHIRVGTKIFGERS